MRTQAALALAICAAVVGMATLIGSIVHGGLLPLLVFSLFLIGFALLLAFQIVAGRRRGRHVPSSNSRQVANEESQTAD